MESTSKCLTIPTYIEMSNPYSPPEDKGEKVEINYCCHKDPAKCCMNPNCKAVLVGLVAMIPFSILVLSLVLMGWHDTRNYNEQFNQMILEIGIEIREFFK